MQDLEDSECDGDSMHGADAIEVQTMGTSGTRCPTQASSSTASSPRHPRDLDEGARRPTASNATHDAGANLMRFDSASDLLPETDSAAPLLQTGDAPPQSTTALESSALRCKPGRTMLPPERRSFCGLGGATAEAEALTPVEGVASQAPLRSSISVSAAGDIDDLPSRLSQQMSLHNLFENVAKRL